MALTKCMHYHKLSEKDESIWILETQLLNYNIPYRFAYFEDKPTHFRCDEKRDFAEAGVDKQ